jgi:ABC-type branched-subunit amino acid transport system ATPase component
VILVEQDASLALRLVERVLVMQGGVLAREGTPAEFLRTDSLQQAYLGAS